MTNSADPDQLASLILKVLSKIIADDLLNCFVHFSQKICLDISCELSASVQSDLGLCCLHLTQMYIFWLVGLT